MRRKRAFRPCLDAGLEERLVLSVLPGQFALKNQPPRRQRQVQLQRAPLPLDYTAAQFEAYTADVLYALSLFEQSLPDTAPDPAKPSSSTFPQYYGYVNQRTILLAQNLVSYFDRMPVQLPRSPGMSPRVPGPRNAIQLFIGTQLTGSGSDSLTVRLGGLAPPDKQGPGASLYRASTLVAIEDSQRALVEGIRLIFRKEDVRGGGSRLPTVPANLIR